MKTERRHELQTNELADRLGRWINAVAPYTNLLVAGVLLAVVAFAIWSYLLAQAAAEREVVWQRFNTASQTYRIALGRSPELTQRAVDELVSLVDDQRGKAVANAAALVLGDHYLGTGLEQMFQNREKARETLEEAVRYYRVASQARQDDLAQRALFGLGRAEESRGDLDNAIESYQQLVDQWPASPLAATASAYAQRLGEADTGAFYAWYLEQNPRKARREGAGDPVGDAIHKDQPASPGAFDKSAENLLPKIEIPTEDKSTKDEPSADNPGGETAPEDAPPGTSESPAQENAPPELPDDGGALPPLPDEG